MFGYMTELDTVEECFSETIEASGHDLQSALFKFLDEWLYIFSADPFFIPFKIEITEFSRTKKSDLDAGDDADAEEEVVIKAVGFGETFQLGKHPQGTEVKAITYSAMQINEKPGFCEVFVIIDI
jgi:SHS2 domain-containing protein